jgi:WD40 repeat protein
MWPLYAVDWNHLTGHIAVSGGDGKVRIFNFDFDSESITKVGSFSLEDEVNSLRWHPTNPKLLSVSCDDGFIHLLLNDC